jgi:hypothetical protein
MEAISRGKTDEYADRKRQRRPVRCFIKMKDLAK